MRENRESAGRAGAPAGEATETPASLTSSAWGGVLRRSIAEFRNDNLSDWAAALTYRSILTLAPGALILVSAVGLLGHSATDALIQNVQQLAPGAAHTLMLQIVNNVTHRSTAGIAALIGLAIAWWSASSYIAAFMRASNAIYEVGEGRPFYKTVPLRLALTAAMVVLGVAASAIVIFTGPIADRVGRAFGLGHGALLVWSVVKWPVLLLVVSLMLALLYYAAPNIKQPGVWWISPGGVLAVIIWLIVSGLFAVYVANFSSYNKTYGALAGVIIFLVWMWLTNVAILLGVEFNAELQRARAIEHGVPPDAEPFAPPRDTRKLGRDSKRRAQALSNDRD